MCNTFVVLKQWLLDDAGSGIPWLSLAELGAERPAQHILGLSGVYVCHRDGPQTCQVVLIMSHTVSKSLMLLCYRGNDTAMQHRRALD